MRLRRILVPAARRAAAGAWWYAARRPLAVPVAAVERDVPIRVFGLGTIEAQALSRIGFIVPFHNLLHSPTPATMSRWR